MFFPTNSEKLLLPQANDCMYMVLEFCAGGSLASYIKVHGRVKETTVRRFMQQLGMFLYSMSDKLRCPAGFDFSSYHTIGLLCR